MFTTYLKRADDKLNDLLDKSHASLQAIKTSQQNPVSIDDLISYSHQVSRRMCEVAYAGVGLSPNFAPYPDFASIEATRLLRMLLFALFSISTEGVTKEEKPDFANAAVASMLTLETPAG